MLCAGATVYEPLKEHGAGPETRVEVVELGGLGHLAVLFARALDCKRVVALSRMVKKRADALELGADEYIAMEEEDEKDWPERYAASLDLIICTISDPRMPLRR